MRDRKRVYLEIWSRIEDSYFDSYMVSEHGLQAALYEEFRKTLPNVHVVVEPTWNVGNEQMKPDLVIVEKGQITDIFELKFVPHYYVQDDELERDIQKLLLYGTNPDEGYPVRVGPNIGQYIEEENLPVRNNCRLHFVAVARHVWVHGGVHGGAHRDVAAVWPKSLRGVVRALKGENLELENNPRVLSHWFGRVGGDTDENREWSIAFGI